MAELELPIRLCDGGAPGGGRLTESGFGDGEEPANGAGTPHYSGFGCGLSNCGNSDCIGYTGGGTSSGPGDDEARGAGCGHSNGFGSNEHQVDRGIEELNRERRWR